MTRVTTGKIGGTQAARHVTRDLPYLEPEEQENTLTRLRQTITP